MFSTPHNVFVAQQNQLVLLLFPAMQENTNIPITSIWESWECMYVQELPDSPNRSSFAQQS